jgi:hypothetical protein
MPAMSQLCRPESAYANRGARKDPERVTRPFYSGVMGAATVATSTPKTQGRTP